MLQIKVFTADTVQDIEAKVNGWLKANVSAEVIQIVQSESGTTSDDWTATITLLYKPQPMVN